MAGTFQHTKKISLKCSKWITLCLRQQIRCYIRKTIESVKCWTPFEVEMVWMCPKHDSVLCEGPIRLVCTVFDTVLTRYSMPSNCRSRKYISTAFCWWNKRWEKICWSRFVATCQSAQQQKTKECWTTTFCGNVCVWNKSSRCQKNGRARALPFPNAAESCIHCASD